MAEKEKSLFLSGRKGTTKVCPCDFRSVAEKEASRRAFLEKHGEDLPESAIIEALSEEAWDQWVEYCDCEKPSEITGAIHYLNNDWYLCTLKGLAVQPKKRGYGIGSHITRKGVELASQNPDCKVLAADITFDNKSSIKCFKKEGFETVGEFCFAKGEKPADILHFIRFKPTKDKTCLVP